MMETGLKKQPNRHIYIEILRHMTPEERLVKAFELSDMTHEALRAGLRSRYPMASDTEVHALYLERLERCRNRNS